MNRHRCVLIRLYIGFICNTTWHAHTSVVFLISSPLPSPPFPPQKLLNSNLHLRRLIVVFHTYAPTSFIRALQPLLPPSTTMEKNDRMTSSLVNTTHNRKLYKFVICQSFYYPQRSWLPSTVYIVNNVQNYLQHLKFFLTEGMQPPHCTAEASHLKVTPVVNDIGPLKRASSDRPNVSQWMRDVEWLQYNLSQPQYRVVSREVVSRFWRVSATRENHLHSPTQ